MAQEARIWAYRVGPCVLLWCSQCGPMGVSEGETDEKMIRDHLESHCEEEQ